MIEYLSTPAQVSSPKLTIHGQPSLTVMYVKIQTIVNALKTKVVELIQDLNGNHVIQKCLNRLSAEDSQVGVNIAYGISHEINENLVHF